MRSLILFLVVLAIPAMTIAQTPSARPIAAAPAADGLVLDAVAARLVEVLAARQPPDRSLFDDTFLTAVPASQITAISSQLSAQNGPIVGIRRVLPAGPFAGRLVFEYRSADVTMAIKVTPESPHRITELLIVDIRPKGDSAARIEQDFRALPGTAGFAIYRLGPGAPRLVAGYNQTRQFAIGSTFKLWVLDTLAEEIAHKRRLWSDVTTLGRPSLPSGSMRNWPARSPVTLHSLAVAMISESDNTATDTLIILLGRERIGARLRAYHHAAPERTLPILTTLEAFWLKSGPTDGRERYVNAGDAAQTKQLTDLAARLDAAKLDPVALGTGQPKAIETIEWFASPADLALLLDGLRRRDDPQVMAILSVNPGVLGDQAARFNRIGFKGGSEPGVLNLSWLVQTKDGIWYAVTASWNNPDREIDLATFSSLTNRLLDQVQ